MTAAPQPQHCEGTSDLAYEATCPPIPEQHLQEIEKRFLEQQLTSTLNVNTEFEYAWALVRSDYRQDRVRGIEMLRSLLVQSIGTQRERECRYFLAVGYFRCKEWQSALDEIDGLLRLEPENAQAASLRQLTLVRMKRDGLLGASMLAVGGLAVLGVASVASWLIKRK